MKINLTIYRFHPISNIIIFTFRTIITKTWCNLNLLLAIYALFPKKKKKSPSKLQPLSKSLSSRGMINLNEHLMRFNFEENKVSRFIPSRIDTRFEDFTIDLTTIIAQ